MRRSLLSCSKGSTRKTCSKPTICTNPTSISWRSERRSLNSFTLRSRSLARWRLWTFRTSSLSGDCPKRQALFKSEPSLFHLKVPPCLSNTRTSNNAMELKLRLLTETSEMRGWETPLTTRIWCSPSITLLVFWDTTTLSQGLSLWDNNPTWPRMRLTPNKPQRTKMCLLCNQRMRKTNGCWAQIHNEYNLFKINL